jgi:hypothetical protein
MPKVASARRGPGRPKVGDIRIQFVVPKAVLDVLMARERATSIDRTRIAANVLCSWASRVSGKRISPYGALPDSR